MQACFVDPSCDTTKSTLYLPSYVFFVMARPSLQVLQKKSNQKQGKTDTQRYPTNTIWPPRPSRDRFWQKVFDFVGAAVQQAQCTERLVVHRNTNFSIQNILETLPAPLVMERGAGLPWKSVEFRGPCLLRGTADLSSAGRPRTALLHVFVLCVVIHGIHGAEARACMGESMSCSAWLENCRTKRR